MRIAVIGADGQLGTDLLKILSDHQLFPLYYPKFDITKPEQTKQDLSRIRPDVVINTAAYHRVDECEDHPEEAFLVNSLRVRDLAVFCNSMEAVLVHFSTDYVFDGKKKFPYIEEDSPNPLSVYAASKLAGEHFVRNYCERYFLIRTCGLYGVAGCWGKGGNFVDTVVSMARNDKTLRVVDDQVVTPTSTEELAVRIAELIQTSHHGLFHLTNEGQCTWYEFACFVLEDLGLSADIMAVDSKTYGAKARRPAYSVLENKKAKNLGLSDFSDWKTALHRYLAAKGYSQG